MSDDFNGPFRLLTRDVIFLGGPAAPAGSLHECGERAVSRRRAISRLQPRSSNTVRWLCGIGCEIAFGQIGNGDRQRPWCSLAFANVPQRLLPKNSPKQLK